MAKQRILLTRATRGPGASGFDNETGAVSFGHAGVGTRLAQKLARTARSDGIP